MEAVAHELKTRGMRHDLVIASRRLVDGVDRHIGPFVGLSRYL
jgi:hypothetical protein